jgi:hypothetical protein
MRFDLDIGIFNVFNASGCGRGSFDFSALATDLFRIDAHVHTLILLIVKEGIFPTLPIAYRSGRT